MGVPFAQVADSSLTRHPSRQGDSFVAKWHPLEKVTKPLVPFRGHRRLLNEYMNTMNRAEQKSTRFAVGVTALDMLTERSQRGS